MKLFLILVSSFAAFVELIPVSAAADDGCNQPPADASLQCCDTPKIPFAEMYKKVASDLKTDQSIKNPILRDCKTDELVFKELKLLKGSEIDVDALVKLMISDSKNEDWNPVIKSSTIKCADILVKKKSEIDAELEKSPFNIKKGECSVLFTAMNWCISKEMFDECPAKKWTDTPECKKGKEWFKNCRSKKELWRLFEDEVVKNGKSR